MKQTHVETQSRVTSKKELELYLFEEFKRLSPELIFTHLEQPQPPAPDILVDFQSHRIGIEIIRHIVEHQKRQESDEELVIDMARRQYQATGKPAVGVSVLWATHKPCVRSDRARLSEALVSIVNQNVPQFGTWCELDWSSLPEPLASSVHHVRIDRLIDYAESHWRLPRGGWFSTVRPEDIWSAIAAKESRFTGYQRYCYATWLLIASEGFGPSSWCEVSEDTRQHLYSTRFSRVFFLATHPKEVIELQVKQP